MVTKNGWIYLAAVYTAGWTLGFTYWLQGGRWNTPSSLVIVYVYKMIPLCIALLLQTMVFRTGSIRKRIGLHLKPSRWYFAAWLAPVAITFAIVGVALLMPGTSFSPELEGMAERFVDATAPMIRRFRLHTETIPLPRLWSAMVFGLTGAIVINFLLDFGNEAGWRGMFHGFVATSGFWRSSYVTGLFWGIWYAPMILQGHNFPRNPVPGVFMMTLCCVLISPLFVFVKYKTGSVLASALMHSSVNGTGIVAVTAVSGGSDLMVGITGASGIVVLAACNLLIWVYLRCGGTLEYSGVVHRERG